MANAGFNAATDLFGMGSEWKVKSSNMNASCSTAECPNSLGDITHRDAYGAKIAPSADYELAEDVDELPDLGTVVTIGTHKVAINSITIKTAKGAPVTATVSGIEVQAGADTLRTYSCGDVVISARHRAQDILALYSTTPSTITETSFAFSVDVTVAEPQGTIVNHDVSNGKVVASYTHTSGDGSAVTAPSVSGANAVLTQPVTTTSPENDYVTTECSVTKSLTGTESST